MSDDIELPLEKLDELWPDEDTGDEESPEPAADDDEPEADEAEETEEEEAGDEEPVGEDEGTEEDEDEETEGDEPAPESDDFLEGSKFDRKWIEKHSNPEVKKILTAAYKSMQGQFTKVMQGVKAEQKESAKVVERAKDVIRNHEAFVKTLGSDAGAEKFLIQVALKRPEVFQKAYEKAAKVLEDPTEKESFERDQKREEEERQVAREKDELLKAKQQRVLRGVTRETERAAKELGVSLKVAKAYVVNRIHERAGKITKRDVRAAVETAAEDLKGERAAARRAVATEATRHAQETVRNKLKGKKRPVPPKAAAPSPIAKKRLKTPKGADPTDYAVDHILGLDS